ncbi:hypothetical protein QR680_000387 [Steinernema hermaphroditum]|uniref:RRM domain-containing protein n=1 Tax=Steinernema hermaphroditum TaxID=289476 RepID=A0AA39GV58_9BILA|nr:hypothetical protein QR680_000387 [Steinernema hermaphroditum]
MDCVILDLGPDVSADAGLERPPSKEDGEISSEPERQTVPVVPISEQKERKLFLGGLRAATTEADIRACFDEFGLIQEAVVIRKRADGHSEPKYFGYVTFQEKACAERALNSNKKHVILGRDIDVKPANRSYLHNRPKPPMRYRAHHPLDPLEHVEEPPPPEELPYSRTHKYGFYDHCADRGKKNREDAARLNWKKEKINIDDDDVQPMWSNKRKYTKEYVNSINSDSDSSRPTSSRCSDRPNRFASSLGFMKNMGMPIGGAPLRATGRRSTAESESSMK